MTNTIICSCVIAALFIWVGWIVGKSIYLGVKYGRPELIKYIKNFKFGKWAAVNVAAIPLFTIAYVAEGKAVGDAIFRAITSAVKLITLSLDFSFKLVDTLFIFKFTLYLTYSLIVLNTVALAISLGCQGFWFWKARVIGFFRNTKKLNYKKAFGANATKQDILKEYEAYKNLQELAQNSKCFIIGDDPNNVLIYKSRMNDKKVLGKNVKRWDGKTFVLNVLNRQQREQAFIDRITTFPFKTDDDLLNYIKKSIIERWHKRNQNKAAKQQKVVLVINYKNELQNIELATNIVSYLRNQHDSLLKQYGEKDINKHFNLEFLDIYVYGGLNNAEILEGLTNKSFGTIHFKNKNSQIADDFVEKYPIVKYLNDKQIDKKQGLIKNKDVKINVLFVGLGDTNKELFLQMFVQNQFFRTDKVLKRKDIELGKWEESDGLDNSKKGNVSHNVNYYFFDKNSSPEKKYISHYYNRFIEYEKDTNDKRDYKKKFLLPQFSGKTHPAEWLDVKGQAFYKRINEIVGKENKLNLTYVIVSLGDNGLNIDVANKINELLSQKDISNYHIFVSSRNTHFSDNKKIYLDEPKGKKNSSTCSVTAFGCPDTVVYNYHNIIAAKYTNMAIMVNALYDITHTKGKKGNKVWELDYEHKLKWNNNTLYNFESSLSSARAIAWKLKSIGLDLVPINEVDDNYTILTKEAYEKQYSSGDPIEFRHEEGDNFWFEFKPTKYSKTSVRSRLSAIEHNRWNSFIITWGYIPMSIAKAKKLNSSKDPIALEHANLISFEDLYYYWQLKGAEQIKEDYSSLDNAYWLAVNSGFAIVKPKQK